MACERRRDHRRRAREESAVPRYLFQASYEPTGTAAVRASGGPSRRDAVAQMIEGLGGRLESFDFAFGDRDAFTIVDLPDNAAAAALAMTVNASGAVRLRTTVLLSPEEVDEAAKRSV